MGSGCEFRFTRPAERGVRTGVGVSEDADAEHVLLVGPCARGSRIRKVKGRTGSIFKEESILRTS
jgi:hypothetical protein